MFGYYDVPLKIVEEGISLCVQKEGKGLVYRRECLEEQIEKNLLASKGKILLNPVEPVNKPKALTSYLLIEFEKALMTEPKGTKTVFLTFPVEIGVYITTDKDFEILDILTLTKQKFTLYGDPKNGVICKYWKSPVYSTMPSPDPIREGFIELNVINTNSNWIEATRAVFNALGMKLYYNNKTVSMKANMNLRTGNSAETEFVDIPLKRGMKKSLEIYKPGKLSVVKPKFIMEFGL
jgi:hypothetical protein